MSRYILIPNLQDNSINDIIYVVPTEGITDHIRTVELPKGLLPRITNTKQIKSDKKFINLLFKLSKTNIGRNKDGLMTIGSKVLDTKFDDFVINCCNGKFKDDYENVYCILRNYGITF